MTAETGIVGARSAVTAGDSLGGSGVSMGAAVSASYSCELRKIFWRAKYRIILAVYAVIGLAFGVIVSSGFSIAAVASLSPAAVRDNVMFGVLTAYRAAFLPLAAFMLAADTISHEIESKSIKCALYRPVSRFDVYLAKALAMLTYLAVALAVGFVLAEAWQVVMPVVSRGIGGAAMAGAAGGVGGFSVSGFLEALASYALTLVPMAAFVALASFLATSVKSPALVMFLCIAAYGVLAFTGTFLGGFGAALFTAYTGWYRMWLGDAMPLGSLLSATALLLSTSIAFFGLGYLVFDRKDI